MYRKALTGLALLMALSAIAASSGDAQKPGYAAVEKLALHRAANGVDGTLELLLDMRLTESVRKELWGKGDWSFVFPHDSQLYKEFSALAPAKSKLTIRNKEGRLVADRELDTPLAKLETWNASSEANQLFLLTEDRTPGMGSYNGPGATLLQVSDAAIHDVKALNTESHQEEPIRLVKSLKSDWHRKSATEILSVSCRPKDDRNFVIDYVRYSFDGTRWLEYKRETDGFWESDEAFPEGSSFP
jgi:hypothetical protein